ncbi:MAG: hypothetical protein OEZ58_13690 [Gammaproteobacteria bacterium]|nr:hypothetical protein [Gammaproteobacteria bacterium]MDH5730041.1 hypothetical protein [Gammaproteobacteria bacterium]
MNFDKAQFRELGLYEKFKSLDGVLMEKTSSTIAVNVLNPKRLFLFDGNEIVFRAKNNKPIYNKRRSA